MHPKDLYRLCLQPSPLVPLRARLRGLESLRLYLRPPCFHELGSVALAGRLLMLGPDRPAFPSGDVAAASLDAGDLLRLAPELRALEALAPHYGAPRSDALAEGARELANLAAAYQLGGCFDALPSGLVVDRPDRYFGKPLGALLDCQWLAYRAARDVYEQALHESKPTVTRTKR